MMRLVVETQTNRRNIYDMLGGGRMGAGADQAKLRLSSIRAHREDYPHHGRRIGRANAHELRAQCQELDEKPRDSGQDELIRHQGLRGVEGLARDVRQGAGAHDVSTKRLDKEDDTGQDETQQDGHCEFTEPPKPPQDSRDEKREYGTRHDAFGDAHCRYNRKTHCQ